MLDLKRALAFVTTRGDIIERAGLASILIGERPPETAFWELATLQKPNGGFAYWVREVSNVCDTAYVLQWLDDLKAYRGPVVEPACRFLLERQRDDGGWDEVEEVLLHDSPEWMIPGRIETRVWLTAFCAHLLIRFGYAEAPGTRCPSDFLLANADQAGRLAGYPRATWLALPMLAFYPGLDSEPFRRALAVTEASFSRDWGAAYLAWLLRCLQDSGLSSSHRLVTRCLDELERRQRADGSWAPEEGQGEDQSVNATVAALRALKEYGRI
jgi:hypothetical protein